MGLLSALVVFISKGLLSPVAPVMMFLERNALLKATKMHKMTRIWMDLQLIDISMSPSLSKVPPSALLKFYDVVIFVCHCKHFRRLSLN